MNRTTDRRKPDSHLIHLLETTKNHHPNFTLLLGAGASVESGVKSAKDMISDWRATYQRIHVGDEDAALEKQSWYGTTTEYSYLFESLYDQPTQRREYIESCIEHATPSWGYMYLVDLIRRGVFNTIFTTNFDDLLNEACYLYSTDVRPVVCAHDSSIRSVRITTKRPKIIKLHGDFLFDSIKNTVRELESLEGNMREKFRQFASEYGLIVIGYSGRDRTIMDTLDAILRNDDCFPHGVYWCVKKGATLNTEVDQLRRFPRFHIIETGPFNAFLCELHNSVTRTTHPIIDNPYGVAAEKLANLLNSLRVPTGKPELHQSLARDVSRLGQMFQQPAAVPNIQVPHQLLAWNDLNNNGNPSGAARHIEQELKRRYSEDAADLAIEILKKNWDDQLSATLISTVANQRIGSPIVLNANDVAVGLMQMGRFFEAAKLLDGVAHIYRSLPGVYGEYFIVNRAQIYRHLQQDIPAELRREVRQILDRNASPLSRFGAAVCLGENGVAAGIMRDSVVRGSVSGVDLTTILEWPICRLLPPSTIRMLAEPELLGTLGQNPEIGQATLGADLGSRTDTVQSQSTLGSTGRSVTETVEEGSKKSSGKAKPRRSNKRPDKQSQ